MPLRILLSILALLLLCTPFWAVGTEGQMAGLPVWVIYVVAVCVVFPAAVSFLVQRNWEALAQVGDSEKETEE